MKIRVPRPDVLKAGMEHAQEYLKSWDQGSYIYNFDTNGDRVDLGGVGSGEPPCGTTCCLAGHILLGQGWTWDEVARSRSIAGEALDALGFNVNGGEFGDRDTSEFVSAVFYQTDDDDNNQLAGTQEAFDKFKEYVTEVTGVEL